MADKVWRIFFIGAAFLLALAIPLGAESVEVVAVLVIVGALGAVEYGIRRWKPVHPYPWRAMQVGTGLFLAGNLLRAVGLGEPSPSPADIVELLGYACAIYAAHKFASVRAYRKDPTSLIDACVGVGGAGVLVWVFLMVPYLRNDQLTVTERGISVAFSLLSLTLATIVARLAIGDGVRARSYYLLALTAVGAVLSDVVTSIGLAPGGSSLGWQRMVAAVVTTITFIGLGSASLHPSMGSFAEPAAEPLPTMSRRRLVWMTIAVLIAPLTLLLHDRANLNLEAPVVVAAWVLVTILVMLRVGGLSRSRERAAAQDRVLGITAQQLLGAGEDEVDAIVAYAAIALLAPEAGRVEARMAKVDDPAVARWCARPDIAAHLLAGHSWVPRGDDLAAATPAWAQWLALSPLVVSGELRAVITILADRQPGNETVAACDRLAREVAVAVERVELTAETQRRRTERRFRALVEGSVDLVVQVDDDLAVVWATPACEQLIGVNEDVIIGHHLDELVEVADHAALLGLVDEARATGVAGPLELRVLHVEHGSTWCEAQIVDRRTDPNVGTLVVTVRGIDERKTADERLTRSEARFRALVQHSSDVVAVLDDDRIVSYVSPSVLRVLGHQPDDMVDRELVPFVHLDDRATFEHALASLSSEEGPPTRVEVRVLDGSGGWRTLDMTISDLRAHHAVQGIVLNAHDVSVRKDLELDLAHQALYDDLSGLGNRVLLRQRLEVALLHRADLAGPAVAVLFIDLDHFKVVNDSLGHATGDELLVMVADRLGCVTRAEDTCARLGGDEFAILMVGADRATAVDAAERIRAALQVPFRLRGRELRIDASIGIAFADGETTDLGDLMRNADTAMYAAKRDGKSQVVVFDPAMHVSVTEQLDLMNDLSQVLERRELMLYYQPLVELRSGRVKGFEALVRWQHPTRGLVAPASFIPLAEESGLIVPITEWVLDEAVRQLAVWRHDFADDSLMMNINLSPRHLREVGLVDLIRTTLERHELPPGALVVELTESVDVDVDSPEIRGRLEAVTDLGVELAADDFGTGFASYANLQLLPYTVIKIDRKLISGLTEGSDARARIQIRSIVEMAHAAGMTVVAEGIEGGEQVAFLRLLGCDVGQGFYFSRPVPPHDAERLLVTPAAAHLSLSA